MRVLGISAWALKTILESREAESKHHGEVQTAIAEIRQAIWGRDGNNGHASELRALRRSFRRIERYLMQLGYRVQRAEEKLGLDSGEHEKFNESEDD